MSRFIPGMLAAVGMLVIAGCASHREDPGPDTRRMFTLKYPPLTNGILVLLTNTDGFSAQVVIKDKENSFTGQLMGMGGRFLFLPADSSKTSDAVSGGMSFIWDASANNGYVLSEALQGYAPINSESQLECNRLAVENPVFQTIRGRACKKSEAELKVGSGEVTRYVVWQATDANHFPMRIESAAGTPDLIIEFSKVQFKTLETELFLPPNGFTRYANSEGMMTELALRNARMKKPTDTGLLDRPVNAYDDFQSPNHNQPGRGF